MRKIVAILMLLLPAIMAGRAESKTITTLNQNEFMTAESLDAGMTQAGIHFSAGEGYQTFYPAIRYGVGAFFEVGGRFGFTNADVGAEDKVAELIGIDIKYQMIKQTEGIPIDLAIDLAYDTHFLNGDNLSELTFSALFSRSFPLTERGYKLTPYGGLEFSSLYGSYINDQETDFYLFAGVEWKMTQKALVYLELKAGDNTVGGIGVRFEY